MSSDHQNPTGQPVVLDVVGFAMTRAMRLGDCWLLLLGSLRLMFIPSVNPLKMGRDSRALASYVRLPLGSIGTNIVPPIVNNNETV